MKEYLTNLFNACNSLEICCYTRREQAIGGDPLRSDPFWATGNEAHPITQNLSKRNSLMNKTTRKSKAYTNTELFSNIARDYIDID